MAWLTKLYAALLLPYASPYVNDSPSVMLQHPFVH
jgi:hypothetical protein